MEIHVGIIPDGNRRWAKLRGEPLSKAYEEGYSRLRDILSALLDLGVRWVSVYAMSRDNCIKRPGLERRILYSIAERAITEFMGDEELERRGIRVQVIGDTSLLPGSLAERISELEKATRARSGGSLNVALCYSFAWELGLLIKGGAMRTLSMPPLDLVIRTGAMRRLSSFFPHLAEYAELYFTDTLWPDFTVKDLYRALEWFRSQRRNFGR